MENKSQSVLLHLVEYKKITTWDAIKKYKATRLSSIIFNLREKGHKIESKVIRKGQEWYVEYIYKGFKK